MNNDYISSIERDHVSVIPFLSHLSPPCLTHLLVSIGCPMDLSHNKSSHTYLSHTPSYIQSLPPFNPFSQSLLVSIGCPMVLSHNKSSHTYLSHAPSYIQSHTSHTSLSHSSKCPSDARWTCRGALCTGAVAAKEKR